ncbi:hypothetical protein FKM82_005415 [Ascaphus truei]
MSTFHIKNVNPISHFPFGSCGSGCTICARVVSQNVACHLCPIFLIIVNQPRYPAPLPPPLGGGASVFC